MEKIGDISDILTSANGVYIIKLLDRKEASFLPLDKVSEKIKYQLVKDKRNKITESFASEIRESSDIVIYPEVLESIRWPAKLGQQQDEDVPPGIP